MAKNSVRDKLIHYLSNDVVNPRLAQRLAAACGLGVLLLDTRDALPTEGTLIVDWDHLPEDSQQAALHAAKGGLRVIVHTYHVASGIQAEFAVHRIVLRQRLDRELFAELMGRRQAA